MPSKKKNKKDNKNKAKPSDLGTGGAAKAGEAIQNRRARLDAIINAASGGKPRKGEKGRR